MQQQVVGNAESSMVRVPGTAGGAVRSRAPEAIERPIERIDQRRCEQAQMALAKLLDAGSNTFAHAH